MATNATINHLAFHGTGYELVNDTLNVTVFSSQETSESIPSYTKASTTQDGLMSKEDKAKLDDFKTADKYVTVVSGKDLSTNDFTNEYKDKVDLLVSNPPTVDTSQFVTDDQLQMAIDEVTVDTSDFVTTSQLQTAVNNATVDTSQFVTKDGTKVLSDVNYTQAEKTKLDGIAENAQVNKIESIKVDGTTLPISDKAVNIVLSGKVDTIAGKQLSTNDFTNDYKNKIDGATVKASASQDGLMSKEDYSKLSNVEANANKYVLSKATSTSLGGVKIVEGNGLYMDGDTLKVNVTEAQGDFSLATTVASGLMSSSDKKALESLKAITDATTVKSGYMSTSDKIKLNGIDTLYATKSEVSSAVASVYKPKGSVNSFSDLPNNASEGDVYNIKTAGGTDVNGNSIKAGDNIVKVSNGWDVLAGTVDLSGYATTVNASATTSGLMSYSDKSKLDSIEAGANKYSLPTATSTSLGGVKVSGHDGLTMDNDTIKISYGVGLGISPQYNLYLKRATDTEKGGVIVTGNDGLTMDGETLKANIPTASQSVKGGAKIGNGLTMSNDTVQVSSSLHLYNSDGLAGTLKLQHRTTYGVGGVLDISATNADAGSIKADGQHGGVIDLTGVHNGGVIRMTGDSGGSIDASGNNYGGVIDLTGRAGSGGSIIASGTDTNSSDHGGLLDLSGYNGGVIDLTGVNSGGSIKGDVIFTGTPTFANGASGIVSSLPTASQTVKGGVKIGKALKMTAESVGVDTLDAEDVYLSTEVVDSLINQLTVSSASSVSSSDFSDIVTMSGGFTIPDSTSSSFGNYDTVTFGSHALINFGNHASIKNGTASELKFMDKVDFQDGFTVANSVRSDFGTNSSLVADNMLVKFTNSNVLLSGATVQGNPTFTNKISFNSGFTTSASVSSNFGSHNTVVADNAYINLTSSEIHVNNADFVGKPDFNSGFNVSDSISTSFGNYDTVTFNTYSKVDLKNNSSLIADRSNLTLNNSPLTADRSNLTLNNSTMSCKNATVSGNPVFTGTPQFNNGLSSDTVVIPSSVFDSIMEDFVSVASAKQNPTIVFNPTSISKRTDLSEYSFSYTITSDATSHSHYFIDSFEPEDKHQNVTVSGLSGSFTTAPIVSSGTGYHRYYIQVPESTNYKSGTFTYQVDYEGV